jgi:hypothetical protein
VQTFIALFRGPSFRQAELVTATTHPGIVARIARDLIEVDGDDTPGLHQVLDEALGALRSDQASKV